MLEDTDDLAVFEAGLGLATAFHREVIVEDVETLAYGEHYFLPYKALLMVIIEDKFVIRSCSATLR